MMRDFPPGIAMKSWNLTSDEPPDDFTIAAGFDMVELEAVDCDCLSSLVSLLLL